VRASVMERRFLVCSSDYEERQKGRWASVVLSDGTVFEGAVEAEVPHGIYLLINGDSSRLNMFTWGNVLRVVYKELPYEG